MGATGFLAPKEEYRQNICHSVASSFNNIFSRKEYPMSIKKLSPQKLSLLALVILFFWVGTATAHFFGGRFSHTSGTVLDLGYTTNGSWQGYMGVGFDAWNSSGANVDFFPTSISSSDVDFYGGSYPDSWWGNTVHHPCLGGGCTPYSYTECYINTRVLTSHPDLTKNKVAAHEIGHAMGLAHTSSTASYRSILKQGTLSYSTPQTHDVNDIDQLYP